MMNHLKHVKYTAKRTLKQKLWSPRQSSLVRNDVGFLILGLALTLSLLQDASYKGE